MLVLFMIIIYTYICMCVYIYIHMCIYIYIYVNICFSLNEPACLAFFMCGLNTISSTYVSTNTQDLN